MDTRSIGSLRVSIVGLGCNNFGRRLDSHATERVVHAALDAGITFFDTADIYGNAESEVFLGRALAGRRDQAIIATKFGMRIDDKREGANPDYVRRAVEDSLKRLNVEQIDLFGILGSQSCVSPIGNDACLLSAMVESRPVVGNENREGIRAMQPRQLERVVKSIDTRLERVEQVLPTLATRDELHEAIAPLATKAELAEAIAPLATKAELAEAIAPLATKAELAEGIAPLATRAELREEGDRTRRHFDVVAERLEGQIRLVAEGVVALRETTDRQFAEVRGDIAQLDRRVMRLEAERLG